MYTILYKCKGKKVKKIKKRGFFLPPVRGNYQGLSLGAIAFDIISVSWQTASFASIIL